MNDGPIVIGDAEPKGAVLLIDLPPMDLPSGAVLNDDGGVTLTLDHPAVIVLRAAGSGTVAREEPITQLVLRRLTGAEVRKMITAKNAVSMALALSSGLGPARLNLLMNVMDARDEAAANNVVSELLGGLAAGLPDQAEETPEGIVLKLYQPAVDEEGTAFASLTFKRLTAMQRRQAAEAPNLLDWGVSLAAGVTPRLAKSLVDSMDGADAVAANRVILFLCGSGRRGGG